MKTIQKIGNVEYNYYVCDSCDEHISDNDRTPYKLDKENNHYCTNCMIGKYPQLIHEDFEEDILTVLNKLATKDGYKRLYDNGERVNIFN